MSIEVEGVEWSAAIEAMTQEVAEWVKAKGWLDDRTFGDEIRLLDDCHRHGIDLYAEYRAKMAYNWTRAHRHGDKNL